MKQGQTLDLQFRGNQTNARDVAARVRPTLGDAGTNWVGAYWSGDNRNCARRCASRMNRPVGCGDDDIGFVADQRLRQRWHLILRTHAKINDQIAAFDEAARRQVGQRNRTDNTTIRREREHTQAPDAFRSV